MKHTFIIPNFIDEETEGQRGVTNLPLFPQPVIELGVESQMVASTVSCLFIYFIFNVPHGERMAAIKIQFLYLLISSLNRHSHQLFQFFKDVLVN